MLLAAPTTDNSSSSGDHAEGLSLLRLSVCITMIQNDAVSGAGRGMAGKVCAMVFC